MRLKVVTFLVHSYLINTNPIAPKEIIQLEWFNISLRLL